MRFSLGGCRTTASSGSNSSASNSSKSKVQFRLRWCTSSTSENCTTFAAHPFLFISSLEPYTVLSFVWYTGTTSVEKLGPHEFRLVEFLCLDVQHARADAANDSDGALDCCIRLFGWVVGALSDSSESEVQRSMTPQPPQKNTKKHNRSEGH